MCTTSAHKAIAAITLLLSVMPLTAFAKSSSNFHHQPREIKQALQEVLIDYYGSRYNAQHKCLEYQGKQQDASEKTYCIRGHDVSIKNINGQKHMYVMMAGEVLSEYSSSRAASGMSGLFELVKNQGRWQLVASNPEIMTGQWGKPALNSTSFHLKKIGPDAYGWVGVSAYSGAGGEYGRYWSIYAPIGKQIKEVVDIEINHKYVGNDRWQQTRGFAAVQSHMQAVNGYYPIHVNLSFDKGKAVDGVESFDEATTATTQQTYNMTFSAQQGKFVK